MLIIIDAGHGGNDSGAVCSEFYEKDMNLKISLYQYDRFKELGVDVGITRNIDKSITSNVRAKIVKNSGAKVCLCNHNNAASSPNAEGATAIYSIFAEDKFASMILNEIGEEGQKIRKAYTRRGTINKDKDYYFMHRLTGSVETVIIEYAFLTNYDDMMKVKNNYKRYAEAVIRATCMYLGINYRVPNENGQEKDPSETVNDFKGMWIVQVGAFKDKKKAEEKAEEINKAGFGTFIYQKD